MNVGAVRPAQLATGQASPLLARARKALVKCSKSTSLLPSACCKPKSCRIRRSGRPSARSCETRVERTITSVRTAGTFSEAASAVRTETQPLNWRS